MSIHHLLKEQIVALYSEQLDIEPQLKQDALQIKFDSGLALEIRYLNRNEYSLQWLWGDAKLCIDTAPLHSELTTFPNHLHDADDNVRPDTVTRPGREPWDNVRLLIDRLSLDPLLERE